MRVSAFPCPKLTKMCWICDACPVCDAKRAEFPWTPSNTAAFAAGTRTSEASATAAVRTARARLARIRSPGMGDLDDRGAEPGESPKQRHDRELIELLNELRVALPGVQVLFAFLLAVPFAQGWNTVTAF